MRIHKLTHRGASYRYQALPAPGLNAPSTLVIEQNHSSWIDYPDIAAIEKAAAQAGVKTRTRPTQIVSPAAVKAYLDQKRGLRS